MAANKINSDDITHQHVGKYIAIQNRYKLPNGTRASTLIVGVLEAVTHALDSDTATVTSLDITLTEDETFTLNVRRADLHLGSSMGEVVLAVAELAAAADN